MEPALDAIFRNFIQHGNDHMLAIYSILLAVLAKNQYK